MTQNSALKFSRRAVCVTGVVSAAVSVLPMGAFAQDHERITQPAFPPGSALDLRGIRLGEHAILRTEGYVVRDGVSASNIRAWTFREDTLVSWKVTRAGQIIEQRRGRIHVTPSGRGKTVEISTGPVEEVLDTTHSQSTIATSAAGQSLILASGTLTPSDVWHIADDPVSATLPSGLNEFRVFRAVGNACEFYWALRSPWLAALGDSELATALIWRGQGRLTTWRNLDGFAAV